MEGWGAHRGETTAGGRWGPEEKGAYINVLELWAILFALRSLTHTNDRGIKIYTDNTTAVTYVSKMGGIKSPACNEVAREIWMWAEVNKVWLTITHIPGTDNILADFKSRNFSDNTEWSLNEDIFKKVVTNFGQPEIDLFASRVPVPLVEKSRGLSPGGRFPPSFISSSNHHHRTD